LYFYVLERERERERGREREGEREKEQERKIERARPDGGVQFCCCTTRAAKSQQEGLPGSILLQLFLKIKN
jgi:hypothetical protein